MKFSQKEILRGETHKKDKMANEDGGQETSGATMNFKRGRILP